MNRTKSRSTTKGSSESKSRTTSSEKRGKAFDVMLNYAATKDGEYNDLIQAMSRLRTADAKLHKTMKSAEQNSKDPLNKRITQVKRKQFQHFFEKIQNWSPLSTRSKPLDIHDDEFKRRAERLRPTSAYFLYAADMRDSLRQTLGNNASVIEISRATGNGWRELSEEEKQEWVARAAKEAKLLAEFKEYVRSVHRSINEPIRT